MKKNRFLTRMTALLLVLVCMLGLLPTAALAADAPSSIKMEDCTHNGVSYVSPSLGTCKLHQMTFDYNQKSTIGFCSEHGKGMGWSLEGQTWGNPKPITDPTVQTMMAYYYAHTTGVFTDQAHALGVDDVWGSDYSWTMNAWVQAIIWRYQAGLLADPATACAEELVCVYNNLHHGNYSSIDDLLDGTSFRDRAQYVLDLGDQGVWGECAVYEYQYTGSSTSSHQAKDVQAIMIGALNVIREKYDLTVKKVDATNPNKGLPGARFVVRSENGTYEKEVVTGSDGTYKESKEFLSDLTTRDQRMMQAVLTLVITADTKQQLDTDTEKIRSLSGRCQLAVLKYQQIDGLNTVLPIGTRKINAFRTLTTESLAVFMPFKVQEIMDRGGIYFGENAISHNLIMCNKANLLNQSSFRLGVPGSGKSFSVKEEIAFLILNKPAFGTVMRHENVNHSINKLWRIAPSAFGTCVFGQVQKQHNII